MNRVTIGIVIVFVGLMAATLVREVGVEHDGRDHVNFLHITKGDATLVTFAGGDRVLIDGGQDWSLLDELGRALPFMTRQLSAVVVTDVSRNLHGVSAVLERYTVAALILPRGSDARTDAAALMNVAAENNVPVKFLGAGDNLSFGSDGSILALWPPATLSKTSVPRLMLMVEQKENRTLLGTTDAAAMRALITSPSLIKSDTVALSFIANSSVLADFIQKSGTKNIVVWNESGSSVANAVMDAGAAMGSHVMLMNTSK